MTTQPDTTTDKARRTPRQRRNPLVGYERARTEFHARAQDLLLGRADRRIDLPAEIGAVAALGVPCSTCGHLTYRIRTSDHEVVWAQPKAGQLQGHWAETITANCIGH